LKRTEIPSACQKSHYTESPLFGILHCLQSTPHIALFWLTTEMDLTELNEFQNIHKVYVILAKGIYR
jgi:hypothetical protein